MQKNENTSSSKSQKGLHAVCPCCSGTQVHASRKFYRYFECDQCDAIFVWPRPGDVHFQARLEEISQLHFNREDYADMSPQIQKLNWAKDFFSGRSPSEMAFLDYGCGAGRLLNAARAYGFKKVVGFDRSLNMATYCQTKLNLETTTDESKLATYGKFDVIFNEDAIEHVLDPQVELKKMFDLLKPGGVLFTSTPIIDGPAGKFFGQAWWVAGPADHIQLFTSQGLIDFHKKVGLKVLLSAATYYIGIFEQPPKNLKEKLTIKIHDLVFKNLTKLKGDNFVVVSQKP